MPEKLNCCLMNIQIKNTYDRELEEFKIKYNGKEYILDNKEKQEVEIPKVSNEKYILIEKESDYDDEPKEKIGIMNWIIGALGVLFMLVLESLTNFEGGQTISELIEPVVEKYILPLEDKKSYQLTYHRGYFEMFTHEYKYPYLTDERGNKLKAKYSYTLEEIDKNFIFAKIYRSWVALGLSFMIGVILSLISGYSILLFTIIVFIISEIYINIKFDKIKKQLIKQLSQNLR